MMPYIKYLLFVTFWITVAGCKNTISKERAKDYVNEYIEYNNTQSVGGSTMENARVEIIDVRQVNDSTAVIAYTWSGILKSPPLAHPKPDETITDESGVLELHLKNDRWVFRDE